jgi:putative sterol carrier protein
LIPCNISRTVFILSSLIINNLFYDFFKIFIKKILWELPKTKLLEEYTIEIITKIAETRKKYIIKIDEVKNMKITLSIAKKNENPCAIFYESVAIKLTKLPDSNIFFDFVLIFNIFSKI